MESLNDTSWDVVISGTGLPQSLLALALSRSGKKILHVDRNDYYGGDEAALSLHEAEAWSLKHAAQDSQPSTTFSHASITTAHQDETSSQGKLASPRAYSLALAPQLLYTRSTLLPALVSSRTHSQLEFQAVGSWFLLSTSDNSAKLTRVPGGREDVFKDDALDLKAKRSLMKFLRFVTNYEEQLDTWQDDKFKSFSAFLQDKFNLPPASHPPIIALTLSSRPLADITVEEAVPRIAKHLSSIGVFGPGFGAVLPKWGGLAEIGQVACRASAVGGAVYVLGRGIADVQQNAKFNLSVQLSDGENVTSKWLCGTPQELPGSIPVSDEPAPASSDSVVSRSISIISSPLHSLFPLTSEGGVTPAGAVILVHGQDGNNPPVYLFAHTSEAGECPSTQCIIYASVAEAHDSGFSRLTGAVDNLLQSMQDGEEASVLWRMQYQQHHSVSAAIARRAGPVVALRSISPVLSLEDSVLEDVKAVWRKISGQDDSQFMTFAAREGMNEDDD